MKRILTLTLLLLLACKREPVHDPAPELQQTLGTIRTAIRHFQDDNGRYPHSLEELVPRYLTRVPVDPITGSASTWRLTTEERVRPSEDFTTRAEAREVFVLDVHSGAQGSDRQGKPWSEY